MADYVLVAEAVLGLPPKRWPTRPHQLGVEISELADCDVNVVVSPLAGDRRLGQRGGRERHTKAV